MGDLSSALGGQTGSQVMGILAKGLDRSGNMSGLGLAGNPLSGIGMLGGGGGSLLESLFKKLGIFGGGEEDSPRRTPVGPPDY